MDTVITIAAQFPELIILVLVFAVLTCATALRRRA